MRFLRHQDHIMQMSRNKKNDIATKEKTSHRQCRCYLLAVVLLIYSRKDKRRPVCFAFHQSRFHGIKCSSSELSLKDLLTCSVWPPGLLGSKQQSEIGSRTPANHRTGKRKERTGVVIVSAVSMATHGNESGGGASKEALNGGVYLLGCWVQISTLFPQNRQLLLLNAFQRLIISV